MILFILGNSLNLLPAPGVRLYWNHSRNCKVIFNKKYKRHYYYYISSQQYITTATIFTMKPFFANGDNWPCKIYEELL